MNKLDYCLASDVISAPAVKSATSLVAATGYLVNSLTDGNPAKPCLFTTGGPGRIVFDFGSAKQVQFVIIVQHNLAPSRAGSDTLFEMNATNSWGSPSFSTPFQQPTYLEDGFPRNLYLDLRASPPTYRYASVYVSFANTVALTVGEIVIASAIKSISDYIIPSRPHDDEDHPIMETRTGAGVSTIYEYGTKVRKVEGDIVESSTNSAAIRSWNRSAKGRSLGFVLWPHIPGDDEPWFARFLESNLPRPHTGPKGQSQWRLGFEEIGRGLLPTPSSI